VVQVQNGELTPVWPADLFQGKVNLPQ
jgi:hypothetical protein